MQDGRKRPAFGVIYLDDLQHPAVSGLSDRAFRLWAILCTRSKSGLNGSNRDSVLKVSTLAKSMSTGTEEAGSRKVRRALAELEAAGLVERVTRKAATGRQRASKYTLLTPADGQKCPELKPPVRSDTRKPPVRSDSPIKKSSFSSSLTVPLAPAVAGGLSEDEPVWLSELRDECLLRRPRELRKYADRLKHAITEIELDRVDGYVSDPEYLAELQGKLAFLLSLMRTKDRSFLGTGPHPDRLTGGPWTHGPEPTEEHASTHAASPPKGSELP